MDFRGKNVLVVGAARSGIAAARLLKKRGANVTLADSKDVERLTNVAHEMEQAGVKLCFGKNAGEDLIKEQSLIVASPGIPLGMETFTIARKNGIEVIGEMELAFSECPCHVAAITGTNGKTTTAALAGEIIGGHIKDTKTVGNIGLPFSECIETLSSDSFVVLEASSFQLEQISRFKPKISALLNITPDHLDRHKTLERYIEAKANIFKFADEQSFVILNYDDLAVRAFAKDKVSKVLFFSASNEVPEGSFLRDGKIILRYDGVESELINSSELQVLGAHNVENALAAALVASCAGVPAEIIKAGLRRFKGVPHRLEFVREIDGVKYFNDSKGTNPDASIKALNAMEGMSVLIAGGFKKDSNFDEFTALFNDKVSHLIVLGETKDEILESAKRSGFRKFTVADDYEAAVTEARRLSRAGENVLLSPACASWDMFEDFEKRGERFKELVNNICDI